MASIFLDTSALLRRYRPSEPGAGEVARICLPSNGNTLIIANFTSVEVASALSRLLGEGRVNAGGVQRIWRLFRRHRINSYRLVAVTETILDEAARLVFAHPLRAYDAIQIACALAVADEMSPAGVIDVEFCTADRRQALAASAASLTVRLIE